MADTRRNPFVYGGPVDVDRFVGRQQEVNLVYEQVTSSVRGSVAVIGERRIGKTSLLHYVSAPDVLRRWNQGEQEFLFLFVDCGAIAPMTITRFWSDILKRLARELDRRPGRATLSARVAALLAQGEVQTSDIEFLLEDLREAKLPLVVLLDEFECVVQTDAESENRTRQLLGGLRALINHWSRSLSLIVATRRPLDDVCRDLRFMGSPFYNNFVYVHLRPFSTHEAESLLDQMLRDTHVVFQESDRRLIYELAGTHPLLLQAAAACVFEARRDNARGDVDRRLVLERFMDLTEHQWDDLWRWSSSDEHDVLMTLAKDTKAGNALLAERSTERRTLIKRGLLVEDAGTVRLFSPMLRSWLLERAAEKARQRVVMNRPGLSGSAGAMVFVSYSHQDEAEKEALLTHLRVLQVGAELVEVWSDDEIGAGEAWEAAIEKAVSHAQVAILLVTANFLTSDFILRKEVPALLNRREQDGVAVIPIIARACAWKKVPWLSRMNVRPKNGKPVWEGASASPDKALAAVAEEVARISLGLGAQ